MGRLEKALPEMTIAYYIASPTWGGGEQYVYNLAQQLTEQQKAKCIFLFPPHASTDMIRKFQSVGECPRFNYNGKLWRFSPLAGYQLARLLSQYHVDILHINSRMSYGLAAWAKWFSPHQLRVIATQHLVRIAKDTALWRMMYRQIDTLLCVSQCVYNHYLQPWGGADKSPFRHVEVAYNSVPAQKTNDICNQNTDNPVILYRGRICQEKGVIPMLQRLEQVKDMPYQLWIAGNVEPDFEEQWNMTLNNSSIRDRITMLGFRSDIHELILQCQIGLLPTLAPEAGPLVLLENMSLGLPTITSDNGSQPEWITNGQNGRLCPPNDDQAWVSALRELLGQPSARLQMGKQAQDVFFAQFSYDKHFQTILTIYSML